MHHSSDFIIDETVINSGRFYVEGETPSTVIIKNQKINYDFADTWETLSLDNRSNVDFSLVQNLTFQDCEFSNPTDCNFLQAFTNIHALKISHSDLTGALLDTLLRDVNYYSLTSLDLSEINSLNDLPPSQNMSGKFALKSLLKLPETLDNFETLTNCLNSESY